MFQPGSAAELASVGDDYALLLWDTRAGPGPSTRIPEAHKQQDVQCVDWSAQDTNMIATGVAFQPGSHPPLLLHTCRHIPCVGAWRHVSLRQLCRAWARLSWTLWYDQSDDVTSTGGADGTLKIWDRRKPGGAQHTFELHTRPLMRVEWANYRPGRTYPARQSFAPTAELEAHTGNTEPIVTSAMWRLTLVLAVRNPGEWRRGRHRVCVGPE